MHHPRLADHFEDFTRPHTSLSSNLAAAAAAAASHQLRTTTTNISNPNSNGNPSSSNPAGTTTTINVTYGAPGPTITGLASSYLPIEEIYVAPQYQPLNPEDEDDVVPDQHAAFGISRAMDAAGRGTGSGSGRNGLSGRIANEEPVWRDFGLSELVRGARDMRISGSGVSGSGASGSGFGSTSLAGVSGSAGGGFGIGVSGRRLRPTGQLMGGRRTMVCLR